MIEDDITLRQLRNFITVAETLNFRRAAQQLNVSQPPLSRSIRNLEQAVGTALFKRTSRTVRLTPSGIILYSEATRILESVKNVRQRINHVENKHEKLTIGFIEPVSYQLLPRMLPRFRGDYPDIDVEFIQLNSKAQLNALRNEQIDIGILRPPFDFSGLSHRRLYDDELMLAIADKSHTHRGREIDLADFHDRPFVSYAKKRGFGIYNAMLQACSRRGFVPRKIYEASSTALLLSLVAADVGVALVSRQIAKTPRPGIRFFTINPESPSCQIDIVWNERRRTKASQRLIEHALVAARQLERSELTMTH